MYVYTYIERERERERKRCMHTAAAGLVSIIYTHDIYVCTYMYVHIAAAP